MDDNEKAVLRRRLKAVRLAVATDKVAAKSQTIAERFINTVSLDGIKIVHLYKALPALNEPDTKYIFNYLVEYNSEMLITMGQSDKGAAPPQQKFDLIVVPCLAFDKDNYRLGWGGGWYDRFLAAQPQALKIGLCYQSGFVPGGLPHEPHDIRLDKVITEV